MSDAGSEGRTTAPAEPRERGSEHERPVHHELLHRLVAGSAGATTADVQLLYEVVAPLVYRGTMSSPVKRRRRRGILSELADAGDVVSHDTPRGRVWAPATMPGGIAVRHAATEAREGRGP